MFTTSSSTQFLRSYRLVIFAVFFQLVSFAALVAAPLADDNIVLIVKTGVNTDGTYRFEVADSSDAKANEIWEMCQQNSSIQNMASYYQDSQKTGSSGLSAEEQELLDYYSTSDTDPLYIEIREGSSGAYCDWKGNFTLETSSGSYEQQVAPKVVINRNDPIFTGDDTGLQVQTVVHETGHGVMSQLYGYDSLPETDWLGKAHSGGTVSDEQLAIIEGWAEFIGAYFTGDYTIANDPDNALADNRYAYKDIYTRTEVRTSSEMKKTEGWVASTLLKLARTNVLSLEEMTLAMSDNAPDSFDELIDSACQKYPEKEGQIKAAVSEASFGKIYPSYYSSSNSLASVSDNVSERLSETLTNFNPREILTNNDGDNNKKLFATITGALLGAIAGSPFGLVGITVGIVAGLVIGNIVGNGFASEGYVASPVLTPTGSAEVQGTGEESNKTQTNSTQPITELRNKVDEAFSTYLNSVQHGTIDDQKSSLELYRNLHRDYRQMLMENETTEK